MDGLLPIIRRVRRPLVAVDTPPVVAGSVEPVNAVASPAQTAQTAKAAKEAKAEDTRSNQREEETD